MVMQASNLFITSFDSEVKRAYQAQKTLRDTVRVQNNVNGNTHKFPKAGSGVATEHNRGNDVVAMNASRSRVSVTLTDWDAFDYVDILDINKLNVDDKAIVAQNTADAMGRREDQLIIDAFEDEISNLSAASQIVGDGSAAPTVANLAQAKRILDDNNVPETDRTLIHSAYFLEDLLGITEVTSADYNMVKALVQGDVDTYLGFKFKMIGSRTEGGLPFSASNKRYNFGYHKQAVGLAIGKEMTPMVDWVPQKLSWQVGCCFSAGAGVIDLDGVICIHTSEA